MSAARPARESKRPDSKHLIELVEQFSQQSILVLADFVADEFIFGEISRVSREAPVLILQTPRNAHSPRRRRQCRE